MPASKIQFRCPKCSKTLAVAAQHAGKKVACPGCQTQLKLPAARPQANPSQSSPTHSSQAQDNPAQNTAAPKTPTAREPAQANPTAAVTAAEPRLSMGSPATPDQPAANPFDIPNSNLPTASARPDGFGSLPDASALASNPTTPSPTTPGQAAPNPFATQPATPVVGSPHAMPNGPGSATPSASATNDSGVPIGLSIGGFVASLVVAGVFMVAWLVIAAMTGRELGILAWGMGGAIGAVAGLIARNPSKIYCGAAAGLAMASILMAKVIMAIFLMLASFGMDMIQDFANYSPDRIKQLHALADEKLVNGELEGAEKDFAEKYVKAYFSGQPDLLYGDDSGLEDTEAQYEMQSAFTDRLGEEIELLTAEEKEQLLADARDRHPEWIEDQNHYLAAVHQLASEPDTLPEDLLAHAENELGNLDGGYGSQYYQSVAPNEIKNRRNRLRELAAERLVTMDDSARDLAIRAAVEKHPNWNPFPDASTAIMDEMFQGGKFEGPLADHVEAELSATFDEEYSDYYDEVDFDEIDKRDSEVQKLVSAKLVDMDVAAREQMIADTKARHPGWYGENMTPEEQQAKMEEAMAEMEELGGDGSFLGSLAAVCGPLDLLWIFLGASTAYSTSRKFGLGT